MVIAASVIVGLIIGAAAVYTFFAGRTARLQSDLAASGELQREMKDAHQRELALARADREEIEKSMKAISADVLGRTSKQLAEQMETQRKAEEARARAEIKTVVTPVSESLKQVQQQVKSLEEQRVKAQGEMGEQIKTLKEGVVKLADEAGDLTAALRTPTGSGSWGEIQLENVVKLAGMLEYCDFTTQTTIDGDEGRQRPDLIVNMPGDKVVVVDAKAPMDAFLAAQRADDEEARNEHLKRHAEKVRGHVNTLRTRSYQSQFERTPEMVVMFVPSEGIYQAALTIDPELLEFGLKEGVLIATPTTLIALLKSIHYGWGQERIARSAEDIASAGRELHKRVLTFSEHLRKVGQRLESATKSYNDAIGSFESRVVPKLREIEQSGADSGKQIESIEPIDTLAREIKGDISLPEASKNGPESG